MVIDLRSEGSPTYCTTSVFESNGGRSIASYLYLYFEESYWNGSAFYWIQRWKASCFIFVFVFVFLRSPKVDGQLLHIVFVFLRSPTAFYRIRVWTTSCCHFFPRQSPPPPALQLGAPNNRSAISCLSFGLCLKYLVRCLLHSGRQDY